MDEANLKTLLKTTGLPVVYHHYKSPPTPPYMVYLFTNSDNFGADNKVYSEANVYHVELYAEIKDPASEKLVEDVLDSAEIYWDKSGAYIESEKLYQTVYEIEV